MHHYESFFAKHGIKAILILKVFILGYILVDTRVLRFGDKPLIGQQNQSEAEAIASNQTPTNVEEDEAETVNAGRANSFIEDLLTLPKINSDSLEKEELGKYFAILERKRSQIDDRIRLLQIREDSLKRLEKSVEEKIIKLEEEISFFQQTQQKEKKIKAERLENLVEFYKKMPPKKAAAVFEQLDRDLIVQLFNQFPEKQTMNILSLMNPQRSVEISEYYGRIRSAKEYELLQEINTALLKEFEQCKSDSN